MRMRSRALKVSQGSPVLTYLVCQSRSSWTARMNSSVTRTELLAFWKNTLPYAEASAAFIKETGPDAVPPPASCSLAERILERLTPEPEPPLKITPSLRYQSRIESMVSSTERMKQAEHWGFSSIPQLNQTGLLKH